MTRKKQLITMISLTIILAGMLFTSINSASAEVLEIDTYLFVMATPDPIGVNQQIQVSFQLDKLSPTAMGAEGGEHMTGFTVTITRPDGTTEAKGPYEAWSTSGFFFLYTPTQVGEYSFQAAFPGQWVNMTQFDYYFKPSNSPTITVTVQQDPIPSYPDVPLPTEPWTRPVYGENKGWAAVADNWLMRRYDRPSRFFSGDTAYAQYATAPNSPHILWKKPIIFGGIGGGPTGDEVYYMGLSYEQFYNPMILNGRIIYSDHTPTSMGDWWGGSIDPFGADPWGTYCLDLYTGEEIWYLEGVHILFAQIYQIENPNEHGLIAHLWEIEDAEAPGMSKWNMYDGFTGNYIMSIDNVPLANNRIETFMAGPNGEILFWTLNAETDSLLMWNSSSALGGFPVDIYYPERYNVRSGMVANGMRGIQYNVTIPDVPVGTTLAEVSVDGTKLLATWNSLADAWSQFTEYPIRIREWAYNAETGTQLWEKERTGVQGRSFYSNNVNEGVYTRFDSATLKIYGYSIDSGQELWVTEPITTNGWAYFTYMHHIAYGKLFTQGYDGVFRAFDLTDGSLAWSYEFGSSGYETPYGTWPSYAGFNIADGKIFLTNDDHSPDSVPWRGGKLWVLDAETGELDWSISGWIRHGAIADGIYTALNSLDGQVYTFGKGPTATTVMAPKTEITQGMKTVIEGTVLDKSPGQLDTACVSEASMTGWMEYLHMQKPIPSDVVGVDVTLDVIDANGNFRNIGTATSDMSGVYSLVWDPDIPGKYTIIATFAGSESYGSSFAETSIYVEEAPVATPPPDPTPAPITDTYVLGMGIAILAAVIIFGLLLLRKK